MQISCIVFSSSLVCPELRGIVRILVCSFAQSWRIGDWWQDKTDRLWKIQVLINSRRAMYHILMLDSDLVTWLTCFIESTLQSLYKFRNWLRLLYIQHTVRSCKIVMNTHLLGLITKTLKLSMVHLVSYPPSVECQRRSAIFHCGDAVVRAHALLWTAGLSQWVVV